MLAGAPEAAELDPDGKLGLADAFREYGGEYPDSLPLDVINRAKSEVLGGKTKGETIEIPLLAQTIIPKKGKNGGLSVSFRPLFKEQVFSAAQYLAKLGFELPLPEGTMGDGFIMVGLGVKNKHKLITHSPILYKFGTKDPNVFVEISRTGSSEGPATSIKLIIQGGSEQ